MFPKITLEFMAEILYRMKLMTSGETNQSNRTWTWREAERSAFAVPVDCNSGGWSLLPKCTSLEEWLMVMDPDADFLAKHHNWVVIKRKQRGTKGQKSCGGPRCWLFCQTPLPCDLLVKQSKGKSKSRKSNFFSLKYLLECPTFLVGIYNFFNKKIIL